MILALRDDAGREIVAVESSHVDRQWLARQTGPTAAEWRALLEAEKLTRPESDHLVRLAAIGAHRPVTASPSLPTGAALVDAGAAPPRRFRSRSGRVHELAPGMVETACCGRRTRGMEEVEGEVSCLACRRRATGTGRT